MQILNMLSFPEPSGKPAVTAAHNTSSTSIYLEWTPPALHTLNGRPRVAVV